MKGVILAGGLGTRLAPLTDITNKHLLPVWNQPMIYYPLRMLRDINIEDVLIVVGGKSTGEIVRLIGDGRQFGFKNVYYAYQYGESGIAAALLLAEEFVQGHRFCTILGDNIIEGHLREAVEDWNSRDTRAHLVITNSIKNPQDFGCPEFRGSTIINIEEKPKEASSVFAVTGIYFYTSCVFGVIRNQVPSKRGELEITDVNNWWAHMNRDESKKHQEFLSHTVLRGWWGDAGSSIEGLNEVSNKVRELKIYE